MLFLPRHGQPAHRTPSSTKNCALTPWPPAVPPLQVRCQAYASLAAFPLETLEGIDALRPLWSHVALLQRELRRQQEQGQGSGGTRRQRQAAQQALEECEALVQAALAYEHATRRRTGAASAPAAGPDRRRGGAAAASGAGAAALSHRLQSVLPKQLLGGAAATAGDLLQRLPEVPAAAVLYFYAPPPPPSSSKATAAAAARQAAADYQAVYAELLRQPPVALNAAEDAVEAAQTLAAWAAFLRRWLAAVRAAAKQEAADAQRAAAEAAMQVWAAMQPHLDGGAATPAAAANTAWAAAALCGCTLQPLPTLLTAVQGSLSAVASGGPQHPAAAQRAALAALGALAEGARAALGDPILQQLMHLFQRHLAAHQSEPATAAAAATALGLACRALACPGGAEAATAGQLSAAAERQLRSGLASLLTLLCTAWPAGSGAIQAAASAAGFPVSPTAGASAAADLFPAVASALAAALQPTTASLPMPALLQALHRQLLTDGAHQPGAAAMRLLQAATAAGFKTEALGSGDVGSTLSLLLGHFGSSAGAARPDGRVSGAAAAAAASLLAEALQQGLSPADEQSPAAVLQLLVAAPAAASKLPQAAAAKRGAAEGLAALLAAGAIDPGSADAKTAGDCAAPAVAPPCMSLRAIVAD